MVGSVTLNSYRIVYECDNYLFFVVHRENVPKGTIRFLILFEM